MLEQWLFPAAAIGLIITEIIMIISILKLNRNIEKLNSQTKEYFEAVFDKIKGLIDLFVAGMQVKLSVQNKKGATHGKGK